MSELNKEEIRQLAQWLSKAKRGVFFGGAGVSTASGIPDFRSATGLYTTAKGNMPPEYMLSHSCYLQDPEAFYDFHRAHMIFPEAKPNGAHTALAKLEELGHIKAIVTQNCDGLHQEAGSKTVWELHGSVDRNYCPDGHVYDKVWMKESTGVPRCPVDGKQVRPDIVLYEEGLNPEVISEAVRAIESADLLIIGGTSLNVYPAAGMINYYRGSHLVLINRDATSADNQADLVIRDSIDEVMTGAVAAMEE